MKIDYSRVYRKWHPDTPEHRATMVKYYRRLLNDRISNDKEAPVLDVGCGMGFTILALLESGFKSVSGIESDEGQAAYCRQHGLEVELTDDSIGYLKKNPGRYQSILALDLIEHIPVDVQLEFTRAIYQALRPGGVLVCTVPNANSILAGRYRYICWTHRASFTEHSLDFLLFNAGFQDIRVFESETFERPRQVWLPLSGTRHWWAFRFFRLWRRLEMMAELGPSQGRSIPLSLNLLGVARKS